MEYPEQNAKIARIMGWSNNDDYGRWIKSDGFSKNNPKLPPNYCSDNNLAAEFRQHTMQQDWCFTIKQCVEEGYYCYWVENRNSTTSYERAETEAEASSLACLAAWEAMEGTK